MPEVAIYSFSIKYTPPPQDVRFCFLFDCRGVPNPGRVEELRDKTGLDVEVADFLRRDAVAMRFRSMTIELVESMVDIYRQERYGSLAIGYTCTGGQHRSVYFAEEMYRRFLDIEGFEPRVRHIDLHSRYGARAEQQITPGDQKDIWQQ